MKRHPYENSNPVGWDSNCATCGGKHRDAVHTNLKPELVALRLSVGAMPFIIEDTPEFVCFGDARRCFSRKRAAQLIRRIRSWGGYKMQVVPYEIGNV